MLSSNWSCFQNLYFVCTAQGFTCDCLLEYSPGTKVSSQLYRWGWSYTCRYMPGGVALCGSRAMKDLTAGQGDGCLNFSLDSIGMVW